MKPTLLQFILDQVTRIVRIGRKTMFCGFRPRRRMSNLLAALLIGYVGTSLAEKVVAPGDLPTGGTVVAGQANIAQQGARMDINQSSQRAALDWQTFNVGNQAQVNFNQPSASSVTLNRVLSNDPSAIYGRLTANGQVFFSNPSGVLFAPGAQVDVGGIVASTLNISNADFMEGRYVFSGNGGGVVNRGTINAAPGGYVALFGPQVSNEGVITAQLGTVALAAGDEVTLDFGTNGLLSVRVDQAALGAFIENKGLIQAQGGTVLMTTGAKDALLATVVNNEGVIEANSLADVNGVVRLGSVSLEASGRISHTGSINADAAPNSTGNGGMVTLIASPANSDSRTEVNGSISARGGNLGGDGGFVETSAAHVVFGGAANIDTHAPKGIAGSWLIDPVDFTIAATGGDITGSALGALLGNNNVTIQTATGVNTTTDLFGTAGANGDIFVNDTVGWAANTLTLSASRNIAINSVMTGSGAAKLALQYGQGAVASGNAATYSVNSVDGNAKVNLPDGANFSTKLGSDGTVNNFTVISTMTPFASMYNSTGKFALGADIDAAAASVGKSGGWVGQNAVGYILDGLGHTISNLTITPTWAYQGLFGYNYGTIRNLGISNLVFNTSTNQSLGMVGYNTTSGVISGIKVSGTNTIICSSQCGTIVGWNDGGDVSNFRLTGTINVDSNVGGGAVGKNAKTGSTFGTVSNGTSNATVTSPQTGYNVALGGFIGANSGNATNLTNSGSVTLAANRNGTGVDTRFGNGIGGIVGENGNGTVATQVDGTLTGSTFSGTVTVGNNAYNVGGLVGYNHTTIDSSTNSGSVTVGSGSKYIGGLAGASYNAYGNGSLQVSFIQNSSTFSGSLNAGTSSQYIGGIVGAMNISSALSSVTSSGTVTAGTGTTYVGGLVGYSGAAASAVSILNSTSSATVTVGTANPTANTGTSSVYMGFLIGNGTPTLTGSSFTGGGAPITVSISPLTINYGTTPTYIYSLISGALSGSDTLTSILSGLPACASCVIPGTYSNSLS